MAGGPATKNGKEAAKYNATRHGIRSPQPVIPGVENREDWENHRQGIMDSVSPVGGLEQTLAERVALLSWRLHRVTRYETETISLSQEKMEEDLAEKRRFSTPISGGVHPDDVRGRLKAARAKHRLLKRFPKLEDSRRLSGIDADSILWEVTECTDRARDGEMDPEEILESIPIPGGPGDLSKWEDYEGWTAGVVQAGVEAIAKATGEDPDKLLEAVTENARYEASRAKWAAEQVELELGRMSRERILPDEKALEKIARYEAHLSRQLYQALHELEALQKRRLSGEDSPLARLEVNGGAPEN